MTAINLTISAELAGWVIEQARASRQSPDDFVCTLIDKARREGVTLTSFQGSMLDRVKRLAGHHGGAAPYMSIVGETHMYGADEINGALDVLQERGLIDRLEEGMYFRPRL